MSGELDVPAMAASWLEAVANGSANNFAHHFVPDILATLAAARSEIESLRRERDAASGIDEAAKAGRKR